MFPLGSSLSIKSLPPARGGGNTLSSKPLPSDKILAWAVILTGKGARTRTSVELRPTMFVAGAGQLLGLHEKTF